ncbi:MAG: hypothetical protein M9949_09705 [Candidatus Kapabacteria bacterium]|nr:hypothetical protein [Candidatus Kapabacteria bacterium]
MSERPITLPTKQDSTYRQTDIRIMHHGTMKDCITGFGQHKDDYLHKVELYEYFV